MNRRTHARSRGSSGTMTKTATKTMAATFLVVTTASAAAAAGFVSLQMRSDKALVLPELAFQSSGYVPGYVPGYIPGYIPGYSKPGYVPGYGRFELLDPDMYLLKKWEWLKANAFGK